MKTTLKFSRVLSMCALLFTFFAGRPAHAQQDFGTSEIKTITYTMDDTGRDFYPGDFININLGGQQVIDVTMDCRGESGAQAILLADGAHIETKSLTSYRQTYHWVVNSRPVSNLEIRFARVDPKVYTVTVRYRATVLTREVVRIQVERIFIPQRQVMMVTNRLFANMQTLSGQFVIPGADPFILHSLELLDDLILLAQKSEDSDASFLTQKALKNFLDYADGVAGRGRWHRLALLGPAVSAQVRLVRGDLVLLREMADYFDSY